MHKSTVSYRAIPFFIAVSFGAILMMTSGCGTKYQLAPLEPVASSLEADSGMVVAAHPLASEAGLRVLQEGGNAVDAAIASLFVLNVVEPHASGLGGGGFALVWFGGDGAKVIDYRDRAPHGVDLAVYYNPLDSMRKMGHGGTSVCVPGSPSGWAELHDTWGSLPLARLAEDGIRLAEEGYPIDGRMARMIADNFATISADSGMSKVFLRDGIPLLEGDTLRQPNLAKTFRQVADKGLRSLYRGLVAESIIETVRQDSGYMTLDDLASYRALVTEPLTGSFMTYKVVTVPPPSSGGAILIESLNLIEETKAMEPGFGTTESVHLMAQCINQAYADASVRIGDPDFNRIDWREMTTREFAAKASAGIGAKAQPVRRQPLSPNLADHGNTTHLVVADYWGNVVSITQSINHFFGSGRMAESAGLILNNQMADFGPQSDSLNMLRPWARPRSYMAPTIVLANDLPILVAGTPGGPRIPSTMAQLVINVLDERMDLNAAIDYPRFFSLGDALVLENRISEPLAKGLSKLGYKLHLAGTHHVYFGGAHCIAISRKTGAIYGAADARRSGAPRGF